MNMKTLTEEDIGHPQDSEMEHESRIQANDYSTPYDNPYD